MQHFNDSPLLVELYPISKDNDSDEELSPAEQRAQLAALRPIDLDSDTKQIIVRPGLFCKYFSASFRQCFCMQNRSSIV